MLLPWYRFKKLLTTKKICVIITTKSKPDSWSAGSAQCHVGNTRAFSAQITEVSKVASGDSYGSNGRLCGDHIHIIKAQSAALLPVPL